MHALRHVHRLLVPGGTLVDLHPITEEQVASAGRPIGVIHEPDWVHVDLPNAEARLQQAISEGLYTLETETELDVLQHFDEAEELVEAKADLLEPLPALTARIRAAEPPIVTRMRCVLRRLRAV